MRITIAASEQQKQAFERKGLCSAHVIWVHSSEALYAHTDTDLMVDALFNGSKGHAVTVPLLVNAVENTLAEMQFTGPVGRFCGWATFIERPLWEVAVQQPTNQDWLPPILERLGWESVTVQDEPGLVAPRVVSMIVNEAYFALQENISTKAEIDTAMKLGTNYPYGPFEWAEKIGLENIVSLLERLAGTDSRYEPCPLMENMAVNNKT